MEKNRTQFEIIIIASYETCTCHNINGAKKTKNLNCRNLFHTFCSR